MWSLQDSLVSFAAKSAIALRFLRKSHSLAEGFEALPFPPLQSQSVETMASGDSLGTFARLPLELRLQIWEWLDPSDEISFAVSKVVRRETARVFQDFHLTFSISPLPNPGKYPSAIEVSDNFKRWPNLYPAFLDFNSPDRSSLNALLRFPLDKLSHVQINLELPDPDDPGQIIRVFNSLVWLVDLLGRAPGTNRHINVRFSLKYLTHWLSGPGLLENQFTCLEDGHNNPMADLMKILLPLNRLRAICFTTEFPIDVTSYEGFSLEMIFMKIRCQSEIKFGAGQWHDVRNGSDDSQAANESTVAAYFELLLDDLPGPCARSLRLERFAFWSAGYESNHLHRYWGHFGTVLFQGTSLAVCSGHGLELLSTVVAELCTHSIRWAGEDYMICFTATRQTAMMMKLTRNGAVRTSGLTMS